MSTVVGKVSLVTGGAKGVGKAFTEILLRNGARVCMAERDERHGEAIRYQLEKKHGKDRVTFVKCDVTSQEDMENAFNHTKSTFNGLDLVVNNSGILDERIWEQVITTNLIGVIRGTLLGISHMSRENGGNGGTVINMASLAGLGTTHSLSTYCAAKHGVVAYTRCWAKNPKCESMGLRFHALCPSFADTKMIEFDEGIVYDYENIKELIKQQGILSTEAVADAFMELVNSESNGNVLSLIETMGKMYIAEHNVFNDYNE